MSLVDKLISLLPKNEQKEAARIASALWDMINDLDKRGHLRSELTVEEKEKDRLKVMKLLENSNKVIHAFNMFFDMYVDRIRKNSKQRLNKFLELNREFGFTEEDVGYLLFSEMIFILIASIELFRIALLFTMKMDVDEDINPQTTLGTLFWKFKNLSIDKAGLIESEIDIELRNSLSHGLYWIDNRADIHYYVDITFQEKFLKGSDLYSKMRKQSMVTQLLLRVIGDWFW